MTRLQSVFALALLALILVAPPATRTAWAVEPNRVGLVIQFSEAQITTRCVDWEGRDLFGADILTRSGLEVTLDTGSGLGVIVCQIEGQGCSFPAEDCFCECMGGPDCGYWNYFYLEPGGDAWTYSILGAAMHAAEPGSVEAWVWGNGSEPPSAEMTFESICGLPAVTPSPVTAESTVRPTPTVTLSPGPTTLPGPTTALASPIPAATSTPAPSVQPVESPAPTASPRAPEQGTGDPAPEGSTSTAGSLWPFGLVVAGLVGIGGVVWARRSRSP